MNRGAVRHSAHADRRRARGGGCEALGAGTTVVGTAYMAESKLPARN